MLAWSRVGIELSKVEVRFEELSVEADVHVGGRALPTVLNSYRNFAEVCIPIWPLCMHCLDVPYPLSRLLLRCGTYHGIMGRVVRGLEP